MYATARMANKCRKIFLQAYFEEKLTYLCSLSIQGGTNQVTSEDLPTEGL
jgi:hypothetical protein